MPPFQTLLAQLFPGFSDGVKESTAGVSSKETDDVSEKIQMGTTWYGCRVGIYLDVKVASENIPRQIIPEATEQIGSISSLEIEYAQIACFNELI